MHEVISAKEAARIANVSRSMVTKLCQTGKLNHAKVGTKLLVHTASLYALLKLPMPGNEPVKQAA